MSRTAQFRLNLTACTRDLSLRAWGKLAFHLRGLARAVLPSFVSKLINL